MCWTKGVYKAGEFGSMESRVSALVGRFHCKQFKASHLCSCPLLNARHEASLGVPKKTVSQSILKLFLCRARVNRTLAITLSIIFDLLC